jgi:hypothetical protein
VFPGQPSNTQPQIIAGTTNGGALTLEANPGATVAYSFTAENAGTYIYHSGTRPELQVEMGLFGAIVVRPPGYDPMDMMTWKAYDDEATAYDREELFLVSEMDSRIHDVVEFWGGITPLEFTDYLSNYFPNYWFINGRMAMDTMVMDNRLYPTQPYWSMPLMHPGDRLLMRVIGAGRQQHPFHHHGAHSRVVGRDGRLLQSAGGTGADLSQEVFTIQTVPGKTVDSIFEWTGKGMGWDIYGTSAEFAHTCNGLDIAAAQALRTSNPNAPYFATQDATTKEWCADHGKMFPVALPELGELFFGGLYSGSPFLGAMGALPPGEGGLNPWGGFVYMWHSHHEKELINFDVFPGGLMTMLVIVPPGLEIME